jgi:hypothetical protein
MQTQMAMRVRVRKMDAKSNLAKTRWSRWEKNLVLDAGLNSLAQLGSGLGASTPARIFRYCSVGSDATSNSVPSTPITFTQAGDAVTASEPFFTADMVGAILKYGGGSGGAEQYILTLTGVPVAGAYPGCTVSSSAAVGATNGTVWLVNQTTLVAGLYVTNTYAGGSGDNGFSTIDNVATWQRTFNFEAGPYNANEIGYSPNGGVGAIAGRLVLSSTVVVSPTEYLQVQLQLIGTYSPATPTAVPDVSSGSDPIDTAGDAAIEFMDVEQIAADGSVFGNATLDGSSPYQGFSLSIEDYAQNDNPTETPTMVWADFIDVHGEILWTYVSGGLPGIMQLKFTGIEATTAGQTMYGFGFYSANGETPQIPSFDILLTTPFELPTGTFEPQPTFQLQYSRTLTNL